VAKKPIFKATYISSKESMEQKVNQSKPKNIPKSINNKTNLSPKD